MLQSCVSTHTQLIRSQPAKVSGQKQVSITSFPAFALVIDFKSRLAIVFFFKVNFFMMFLLFVGVLSNTHFSRYGIRSSKNSFSRAESETGLNLGTMCLRYHMVHGLVIQSPTIYYKEAGFFTPAQVIRVLKKIRNQIHQMKVTVICQSKPPA